MYMTEIGVQIHYLARGYLIVSEKFVEETMITPHGVVLTSLSKIRLTTNVYPIHL